MIQFSIFMMKQLGSIEIIYMINYKNDELIESSDMSDFIKHGLHIVDKNEIIYKLLKKPMVAYLLCRPRRFGKTLLLDTVENIFEGRRYLFQNLVINDDKSEYNWKVFPVIRLDMSGTSATADEMSHELVYPFTGWSPWPQRQPVLESVLPV
jgi:hypothetical protein